MFVGFVEKTTAPGPARPRRAANQCDRSTAERLAGYVMALIRRRRHLINVHTIYRDQPAVLREQVEASVSLLGEMRAVILAARNYLTRLSPLETEQVRPWACITKLGSVDYLLTELLLTLAMFADICQSVSQERVQVHLSIRTMYPGLLAAYDDARAMLTALTEKARAAEAAVQDIQGQEVQA